ncbi:MIP/aquaporin family protein [Thermoleophilum album]|uniref:Glycerol uptake facilitator protein n=1 Tax=Thermoleophilum album TaxID=29539 RepID=A0A1H6FYT1_THEAL|nr:aquaporin [Thermoleophilum album]SEH15562.1 glycerol uptake facilitator protein [Thermoleophilum album]
MQDRGPAAYLAEFIGTLLLVFLITATLSLYLAEPSATNPSPFIDWSVIGLVHALGLAVLYYALRPYSGAHLNPAVTLAMAVLRRIRGADAAVYIVCQLAGATIGALLTKLLLLDEGRPFDWGAVSVSERLSGDLPLGMLAEGIAVVLLVFVFIELAERARGELGAGPLWLGGTLGVAAMVFGPLTGSSLNPARAFGPALVSGSFGGADKFLLVYVAAPALAALAACGLSVALRSLPGAEPPEAERSPSAGPARAAKR